MVHIQDGGLPLNRLTFESQINGGMIQSLGQALWEGRVMDAQLGLQLNPGFGDYKLPGTLEMPEMVPIIDDEDKREAVIGIAEGCNIPSLGALANAVFNACGVRVRELPITPDKILMGLLSNGSLSRTEASNPLNGPTRRRSVKQSNCSARHRLLPTSTKHRGRSQAVRTC